MNYGTAHILHSRHFGARQGVNAFLHQDAVEVSAETDAMELLERASNAPGKLVACALDLPPGGNEVDAYLDLLYDSSMELPDALAKIRQRIEKTSSNRLVEHIDRKLFFSFYASSRVSREEALRRIGEALLAAARGPKPGPIRIIAERAAELWLFQLDAQSEDRLRKVHGADWSSMPLRVHVDVADDFTQLHGSLFPHVVEVLSQLAPRHLEGLGGVLVETREGKILLQLPEPSSREP